VIEGVDDVAVSVDSTSGNRITVGCVSGYRSGDLIVSGDIDVDGDLKIKNCSVIQIDDVFQNSINIGNTDQPLAFSHTVVRGSGTKNMNVNVTTETEGALHEQIAFVSDTSAASDPINTAISTMAYPED
jgi:hypothetical protein